MTAAKPHKLPATRDKNPGEPSRLKGCIPTYNKQVQIQFQNKYNWPCDE